MTDSTVYPQVYYVRIPDPGCKQLLSQCQKVSVPVGDPETQEALWLLDHNHDHVIGGDDLDIDTMTATPHDVSNRLARLFVATQQTRGSQKFFSSPESLLSWVKARAAVDRAYETIQWLGSLESSHAYSSTAWQQIEGRLGTLARDYRGQLMTAAHAFDHAVSFPEYKSRKRDIWGGLAQTSLHHGVSYLIDQRAFSPILQSYMNETLAKMIAIFEFDRGGGIRCMGFGCPWSSGNDQSVFVNDIQVRGLMIIVRTDDMFSHTPQFRYLTTHYFGHEPLEGKALEYTDDYLCSTESRSYCGK